MERIFKNKVKHILTNMDYYRFEIGKRMFNGKLRRGCYYYYDSINKEHFERCDNVVFLKAHSQYAPEIIKNVIFIFD